MTNFFTAKPIPFPLRCYLDDAEHGGGDDDESNESDDDGDDNNAMEDKDELKMMIAGNEVESERGR